MKYQKLTTQTPQSLRKAEPRTVPLQSNGQGRVNTARGDSA